MRYHWRLLLLLLLLLGCALLQASSAVSQPLIIRPLSIPVALVADYSFRRGEVFTTEALGIGTYKQQIKAISTTKGPEPAVPVPPDDGIKRGFDRTIYDTDDRRDFFQIVNPTAKNNALAVASISTITERTVHARGFCTAFLVSKNRALTASHCINGKDFRSKVLRFNDQWKGDGFLDTLDSYEIETIDAWDRSHDFALLRIRPNAAGKVPGDLYPILRLEKTRVAMQTGLYMIGHPALDYKKFGDKCTKLVDSYMHPDGKHSFGCDCDAFGGNSGSPIFSVATNNVVGILWGGQKYEQTIPKADQSRHEFIVPVWRLATQTGFDHGTWPPDVAFVSVDPPASIASPLSVNALGLDRRSGHTRLTHD